MSINDFKNRAIKGSQFTSFNYDQEALGSKEYPYSMICLNVDDDTLLAVGCGELSPREFMNNNQNTNFILDTSITPKNMFTMHGQKTVYYAKKA